MHRRPRVLVVAGSDSSGGAGLSRDIQILAMRGVEASLAVTAVTVQTHGSVLAVEPMPPGLVATQMRAALESGPTGAIKIGMLATEGTIAAVASVLREHTHIPAVLDPVIAASSGGALLEDRAIGALVRDLMPACRLVTPNWPELAALSGCTTAHDEEEARLQADALIECGVPALLLKGGHAPDNGRCTDILLRPGAPALPFRAPRAKATLRGSGCMLASCIAGELAKGEPLEASIALAKSEVLRMFEHAASPA